MIDVDDVDTINMASEIDAKDDSRDGVCGILDTLSASPKDEDLHVTGSDIFWTVVSILGRVVSIILTINLALDYYRHGRTDYFIWTLCCFLIPVVITMFLQLNM